MMLLLRLLAMGLSATSAFVPLCLPAASKCASRRCLPRPALRAAVGGSEDTVLALIKDTDVGANATALPFDKRQTLYQNLDALEGISAAAGNVDPFRPGGAALGLWSVDFVGETQASAEVRQKKSSAAGGYWRGELGRKIARTEGLYQHVLAFDGVDVPPYAKIGLQDAVRRRAAAIKLAEEVEQMKDGEWDGFGPSPAQLAEERGSTNLTKVGIGIRERSEMLPTELVAVNLVRVLLFNLIPISIILVGLATRLDAGNRDAVRRKSLESGRAARMQGAENGGELAELPTLSPNTVRVDFSPPIIAAGPLWLQRLCKLSVGPCTDVFLDTTFVSEKLRLGRGATSGSRFVFRAIPAESLAAPAAESWAKVVGKDSPPALPLKIVGSVLKWVVLSRFVATGLAFYFSDPVTVTVAAHGAPVLQVHARARARTRTRTPDHTHCTYACMRACIHSCKNPVQAALLARTHRGTHSHAGSDVGAVLSGQGSECVGHYRHERVGKERHGARRS